MFPVWERPGTAGRCCDAAEVVPSTCVGAIFGLLGELSGALENLDHTWIICWCLIVYVLTWRHSDLPV